MKISLKRTVALLIAAVMVISIMPFTAYSADWIPADFKDYVFDAEYYAYLYPDVAKEYGSTEAELYAHFQEYGVDEGKKGSPTFAAKDYLYYSTDLQTQFGTDYRAALLHYCSTKTPSTAYQPIQHKYFAGTFDAVISRASDTANGAFNVGVASSPMDNNGNGKYNVQALAADITDTKQIWTFKFNANGSYTITNKYTGSVLDVNGGLKASGTNVSTYKSNDSNAQQWRLLERLPGQYVIAPVHASHFVVLDIGGSTSAGTNAQTYYYNHTDAQLFNIQVLVPDEIKKIVFDWEYYGVKYPEVASKVGATEEALYEHFGKFGLMEGKQASPVFSARYYLDNNPSVKSSTGNHLTAALMHYYNTGRNTAGLKTAPPAYIADSFEATVNFIERTTNLGLTSTATNEANNAWNVETVNQSFTDTKQVWCFKYDPETGAYMMTNKAYPNAALDVSGAAITNGTNIATYTNTGVDDLHRYMYIYERIPGEYSISPAHSSGKVIEISGGYTSAGKNIALYEYNKTVPQRVTLSFYFDPDYKSTIYDEQFYKNKYYEEKSVRDKSGNDLYEHFLSIGLHRGYQGSPVFDVSYYIENNEDVKAAVNTNYDAIVHYINTGSTAKKYVTAPPKDFGDAFTATINSTTANVNIGVTDDPISAGSTTHMVKSRDRNDKADAQKWMFVRNDDGSYTLTNVLSGSLMNASDGSIDKGTLVNAFKPTGSIAQNWFFFERLPGQYVVSPVHASGTLALGVQDSALVEGTQADLYTYLAVPAQYYGVTILSRPYKTTDCDVNGDGIVNAKDILQITKHMNKPLIHAYLTDSDVNGDGVIDTADLELIKQNMGEEYGIWYKELTADDSFTTPLYPSYAKRHTLLTYNDVLLETYEAIHAGFIFNGCEIYSDTVKGNLHSTTFVKGDDFYHMYWHDDTGRLRIVEAKGDADALPAKNMYFENYNTTPTITQVSSTYLNGMTYIVELTDGSFIIVDGGYSDQHDRLYNKLVELNGGDKEDIVIRAWLLTHCHNDHYECFVSFADKYASRVRLDYFMYCSETPESRKSGWGGLFTWGEIYDSINKFHGTKVLTVHTGMDFKFGGVSMEILFAPDDMLIEYTPGDQNEMSVISRFYTGTKKALILGDSGSGAARKLEQYYGNYLKSDICQASHHGVEDFPLSTYNLIRAPIMFYPCNQALYDANERFKDVRDAIKNSDYIKEILIHQHGHYTRPLK